MTATRTRRSLSDRQILTGLAVLAGALTFAASLSPALDVALTAGLPALAVTVWAVRRVARLLRWRREDRADALAAAAWRAAAHTSTAARQGVA